ncbi:PRC and DUF2382 domain-containing protein [Deinococcus hohokamensis]|uniref:PRC and DUF2382 domain-containing protein n=1 Tax=Deinococcus hohokamensis TaxID=309883 RepID=A0ABV9I9S0_9DEIO
MARLIPLSEITNRHADVLGNDYYDPTGSTAYGMNGERLGTVRGALAEPESGRIRHLIVDAGGWFSSKEVLVPVGMARIEGDGVYFDNLTRDQVKEMRDYTAGGDYDMDSQYSDERVLRAAHPSYAMEESSYTQDRGYRQDDALYRTPDRLQLLEERLIVNKERFVAGAVEIGKHVETTTQRVEVPLQREEVVIERHAVSDTRPVEGDVRLGAGSETMRVELEAERANIAKQAYVTEEVSVGKRAVTETETHTAEVGREVLDVNQTGEVRLTGEQGMAGNNRDGLRDGTLMDDAQQLGRDGANSVRNVTEDIDRKI